MLRALNLPVSDMQLRGIAKLEKDYLQENVILKLKEDLEPFIAQLRQPFKINVNFDPIAGLRLDCVEENSTDVGSGNAHQGRVKYSIDGGTPMNKRRFVYTIVKQYVTNHPGITYGELEQRFPSSLSHSPLNGVVRKYDSIMARVAEQPDLRKRFFLEDDEVLTLSDGTKVVVYNQWGEGKFDKFLTLARTLHRIEQY